MRLSWNEVRARAAAPDRQARMLGVPRQSLIKLWIAERLKGWS